MIKINVFTEKHENNFCFFSAIVPSIGDEINVNWGYVVVKTRTIFPDNPNFIIVHTIDKK